MENIRIWRSPYTTFGGLNSLCPPSLTDETILAEKVYTHEVLKEIAESGFNGIWLHAFLANIVKSETFPEFGKYSCCHLESIQRLIARCAGHGIKVYLFCQPVRSVALKNTSFWEAHSEVLGQIEKSQEQVLPESMDEELEMGCLCTSTEPVKKLLRESGEYLAENLPGLGGLILITASEYPGHCYSHRRKENPTIWSPLIECPRCKEREPREIVAEMIRLMHEGVRKYSREIKIIAWNWGWTGYIEAPCTALLEKLPEDTIIMAGFEQGGSMELAGRPSHPVTEYSLTYPGPSPVCTKMLEEAERLGFARMTKLQIGTTHELGSVVSFPLMESIYEKASYHRNDPSLGYMGCWNFGNMVSANTAGFNYFLRKETSSDKKQALKDFASYYFPSCKEEWVLAAWETFGKAAENIPFAIPFLYNGVHAHALSYFEIYRPEPLRGGSPGTSYLPCEKRGDDLSKSCCSEGLPWTLDEIITSLSKMGAIWSVGCDLLEKGLAPVSSQNGEKELGNAVTVGALWESAAHAYRAYRLRLNWKEEKKEELLRIIREEIETVEKALPYVEKDVRLGYHGEAGIRFFDGESMRKKLSFLKEMEDRLEKS